VRRGYDVQFTPYMGCNQTVGYGPDGLEAGSDPRGGMGIVTLDAGGSRP
jgi:hypothetical protein